MSRSLSSAHPVLERLKHRKRRSRPDGHRLRRVPLFLGVLIAVLVAVRVSAPFILESAIHDRLQRIPEYTGRVEDIDLGLWRGAYVLDGIEIRKVNESGEAPFFSARRVDFSIAWRELWRGRFVSDIVIDEGRITLVKAATPAAGQLETDERWQDVIQDVFPIEIAHLEVNDGFLRFVDHTREPEVDASIRDMHLVATGLRNRKRTGDENELPAAVNVVGSTVGGGALRIVLRLAPLANPPLFDLDLAVEDVKLPELNDFLRAYANVDVSAGTLDLFMEMAARDEAFRGYVKPFFRDLDFENLTDRNRPLTGRIWESMVNFMENVLQRPDSDQLGTRIPFSGDFRGTDVGTFTAIMNAVRYGFGAAFSEALEDRIDPSDVADPDDEGSGQR